MPPGPLFLPGVSADMCVGSWDWKEMDCWAARASSAFAEVLLRGLCGLSFQVMWLSYDKKRQNLIARPDAFVV